jgi:hypothetical protein
MTEKFKLRRIAAWKVSEDGGGVIHLYLPIEAEARFRHSDLYGANRAPWITPIYEGSSYNPRNWRSKRLF